MTGTPPVAGFVYVIGTLTDRGFKTYVGWTLDPDRRLEQHNNGIGAKSTRGQHWQILYVEKLDTRAAAMSREWHLKRNRRFRRQLADELLYFTEKEVVAGERCSPKQLIRNQLVTFFEVPMERRREG